MDAKGSPMPEQETASRKVHRIIARLLELAGSIEKECQAKLAPVMVPEFKEEDENEITQRIHNNEPPLFAVISDNLLNLVAILKKIEEMLDRVDI